MMTRDEHMAWCKERALAYLPENPADAVASMGSDLGKHPETKHAGEAMMPLAMLYLVNNDVDGVRRWIEGFN